MKSQFFPVNIFDIYQQYGKKNNNRYFSRYVRQKKKSFKIRIRYFHLFLGCLTCKKTPVSVRRNYCYVQFRAEGIGIICGPED